jgi:Lon protease-like protein
MDEPKVNITEVAKKATTEAIEQTIDDVAELIGKVYPRWEQLRAECKDLDASERSRLAKKTFEKIFEAIIVVLADK